jgi:hypothetical protein
LSSTRLHDRLRAREGPELHAGDFDAGRELLDEHALHALRDLQQVALREDGPARVLERREELDLVVAVQLALDGHERRVGVDQVVEGLQVVVEAEVHRDAPQERVDVVLAQRLVRVELVEELGFLHGARRAQLEGDRGLTGPRGARQRRL